MLNLSLRTATLVDLLQQRAAEQPEKHAFSFLTDQALANINLASGTDTSLSHNSTLNKANDIGAVSWTYEELDRQARTIAVELQAMGLTGERVLLVYPPGLEYVAAFFGCLYAGATAVPVYPPRGNRNDKRVIAIVMDSGARVGLSTAGVLEKLDLSSGGVDMSAFFQFVASDTLDTAKASEWQKPEITPETLAFLQYTSGSTGTPKGVMVSHANLMANEQMISTAFEPNEETVSLTWLPMFHDMGLIGTMIQPLYAGIPSILMSPVAFIQKPVNWLKAITYFRATATGGPNFGFEHCVQKITEEDCKELDLSSWDLAYSGAEPIRANTLDRFAAKFGAYGFQRDAFFPAYGLAEATLYVSGGPKSTELNVTTVRADALQTDDVVLVDSVEEFISEDVRELVSCGHIAEGSEVIIVDPASQTLAQPNRVGEIWVSGAHIAGGYWNRPDKTAETFEATLADSDKETYMRTGDLGFMHNGELYVTGRLKDLLIIRGRNHYPQDIELTVEKSHPALSPGCGAAFTIEWESDGQGNEERLVIVQEIRRNFLRKFDADEVISAIRQAVSEAHELQIQAICLLKTTTVPKTSSGKIQRQSAKKKYLDGSLAVIGAWEAKANSTVVAVTEVAEITEAPSGQTQTASSIRQWMVNWLAQKLDITPTAIDPTKPFFEYGLDSVTGVELTKALSEWLQLEEELEATLAWDFPTIEAVSQYLVHLVQGEDSTVETVEMQEQAQHRNIPASVAREETKIDIATERVENSFIQSVATQSVAAVESIDMLISRELAALELVLN